MSCKLHRTGAMIVGLLAWSVPFSKADGINLLGQIREVDVFALVSDGSGSDLQDDSDAAPDFGLFDAAVSVDASVPLAQGHAQASQTSDILPLSVLVSDSVGVSGSREVGGLLERVIATSVAGITFELDKPVPYEVSADFSIIDPSNSDGADGTSAGVRLTGPSGVVFLQIVDFGVTSFFVSGVLEPGQYNFRSFSIADLGEDSSEFSDEAGVSIGATLIIPEPSTLGLLGIAVLLASRRREGRKRT